MSASGQETDGRETENDMKELLKVRNLKKGSILRGIDLEVMEGEMVAVM